MKNKDSMVIKNEHKAGAVEAVSKNGIRIHFITVIGQIEGHYLLPENQKVTKYGHIIPVLAEIEQSREIDGLMVVLRFFLNLS